MPCRIVSAPSEKWNCVHVVKLSTFMSDADVKEIEAGAATMTWHDKVPGGFTHNVPQRLVNSYHETSDEGMWRLKCVREDPRLAFSRQPPRPQPQVSQTVSEYSTRRHFHRRILDALAIGVPPDKVEGDCCERVDVEAEEVRLHKRVPVGDAEAGLSEGAAGGPRRCENSEAVCENVAHERRRVGEDDEVGNIACSHVVTLSDFLFFAPPIAPLPPSSFQPFFGMYHIKKRPRATEAAPRSTAKQPDVATRMIPRHGGAGFRTAEAAPHSTAKPPHVVARMVPQHGGPGFRGVTTYIPWPFDNGDSRDTQNECVDVNVRPCML